MTIIIKLQMNNNINKEEVEKKFDICLFVWRSNVGESEMRVYKAAFY